MLRGNGGGKDYDFSEPTSPSFFYEIRAASGLPFDLPTQAQWQKAARAGTCTHTYTGDTTIGDMGDTFDARLIAWYGGSDGFNEETTTVGRFLPNAYGLYDMLGNVSEECRDCVVPAADYGTIVTGDDFAYYPEGSRNSASPGGSHAEKTNMEKAIRCGGQGGQPRSTNKSAGVGFRICLPDRAFKKN